MPTLFTNIAHGNEPYILAASIGVGLGEIVIPEIYPVRQAEILRRWVGDNPNVYLDRRSGEILDRILFRGNYQDYVKRVVDNHKEVRDELNDHLRDFEAVSLRGERKRFKSPEIELNIGSPISTGRRSFYVFPGMCSEYAKRSPIKVDYIDDFIRIAEETEYDQQTIFIPEINTFSYLQREPNKKEIPTPPLKRLRYHNAQIRPGIFVTLPGSMVLADELVKASESVGMEVYHFPQDSRLPGTIVDTHEVIFNPNILAVLARSGWGTLWLCQLAEKPIITPDWRETDDTEIYHNNRTVEELGLGVVYQDFTGDAIQTALTKVDKIRQLNRMLFDMFGTLDGIGFVQEKIREALKV